MAKITKKDLEEFGITPAPKPAAQPPIPVSEPKQSEYPGDITDNNPALRGDWQKLEFNDPSELVSFLDTHINTGVVTQHPWQVQESVKLATSKPTAQKPYKLALCASNGSGKDKYVIAPFVIWFALCKIQSRSIITSASGNQLTSQTETYIRDLAEATNKIFGEPIFRIRQRYIKCNLSGSEIRLFATDEAGKAEGYHPFTPLSEMAIIINEAKNVKPEIIEALSRCSGYNYWLEISTPGAPIGDFYQSVTDSRLGYNVRKITSYDCTHISPEEIERDRIKYGEHSAIFRSKHLAEFTSLSGQIIIPLELIEKNRKLPRLELKLDSPIMTGIDLAAGGDENAIYICQGGKVLHSYFFRETDTTITAVLIVEFLKRHNIAKDDRNIWADDGGVGHAIIDMLESIHGYTHINRSFNQRRAIDNTLFGNVGAERWYRVARLFEENKIPIPDDELTVKQLTSRFYKQTGSTGRIMLESKPDAKAAGRPSPDRADAFVLCFSDSQIEDFTPLPEKVVPRKTTEELADLIEYQGFFDQRNKRPSMGNHMFSLETKLL